MQNAAKWMQLMALVCRYLDKFSSKQVDNHDAPNCSSADSDGICLSLHRRPGLIEELPSSCHDGRQIKVSSLPPSASQHRWHGR